MQEKTLKQKIKEALNIPEKDFDNHSSDLYIKYTPERLEWIQKNYEYGKSKSIVSTFISDIDKEKYIEIIFWYNESLDI